MKIVHVVGARPNYMKIAPVLRALHKFPAITQLLVHTGQHYSYNMSDVFFEELGMPSPSVHLGVGSGTHAEQTAKVMVEFEKVCRSESPDLVVVAGDVNSTLGCALVCSKLHVPCAHIEAGLRSFDRRMPEEINRVLTDQLCDLLFTPSEEANGNLAREGISPERVYLVGNVMIDSLVQNLSRAKNAWRASCRNYHSQRYGVLTLHRPSNVDRCEVLAELVVALEAIQEDVHILFPAHPRTQIRLKECGLESRVAKMQNVTITPALGYLEFLGAVSESTLVLTDSGGVQEETTALGIPCFTMRDSTERPITVVEGTNTLVGTSAVRIVSGVRQLLSGDGKGGRVPRLWDGETSERIAKIIASWGARS